MNMKVAIAVPLSAVFLPQNRNSINNFRVAESPTQTCTSNRCKVLVSNLFGGTLGSSESECWVMSGFCCVLRPLIVVSDALEMFKLGSML